MKLIKIIQHVRTEEEIKKDREEKKHCSGYIGGFSEDTTPHDCIIEYAANDGTVKQLRKYLKKNNKGYYVEFHGKREFLNVIL